MNTFTKEDLKRFQAESLDDKIQRTLAKVAEWYSRWNNEVYVSFSGGKDSTVLADICARWCKVRGIPLYLVFVNTGLEYPEIQKHVKVFADYLRNKYDIEVVLEILRPKMRIDDYGVDCGTHEKLTTTGCDRTGCIFCAFGCHLESEPSRFQRLKETHPRQYEYCIGGGEYNEDGVWQPNKEGLGMRHVFDELNRLYGDGFIKY